MSVITTVPEPNLWNEICKEFQLRKDADAFNDQNLPLEVNYDASKHTPVFFGDLLHKRVTVDGRVEADFDSAVSHPACVGYAFVKRPPASPSAPPPASPDKRRSSPREYLEHYVFPVLLPALEELLRQAKMEKCFERKRTKFNAGDFLTEYLYKNNPLHSDREEVCLADIPFVRDWWMEHPRAPLPKSLLWSEKEASQIIQSFWRGFKIREEDSVQELRQWQRECREESRNIHEAVNQFWSDKIPNDQETDEPKEMMDQEPQQEAATAAAAEQTDAPHSVTPASISIDCNFSGLTPLP